LQTGPVATEPLVPRWLSNVAELSWRLLVVLALAIVLVAAARLVGSVSASIIVAILIAAAVSPFALALRGRGWGRSQAAGVVTLVVLLAGVAILVVAILALIPEIPEIAAAVDAGLAALRDRLTELALPADVIAAIEDIADGVRTWITDIVGALAGAIAGGVTVAILAAFLTFFLLQDGDRAWVWALQPGAEWQRARVTEAGDSALRRVGGYLRGLAVLAATGALAVLVLLLILGVPYALPLAILVFILGFIPYLGGIVSTAIVALVALATVGPGAAVALVVLIAIVDIAQARWIAPLVFGESGSVHPGVAIVALLFAAGTSGVLGLVTAVPVVVIVVAVAGALVSVLEPRDEQTQRHAVVPPWLERLSQWSWRLLVTTAILALLLALSLQAPIIVMPVILGIVFAATLAPAVSALSRRGLGRGMASFVATLAGFGVVLLIVGLTLVSLAGPVHQLVEQAVAGAGEVSDGSDEAVGGLVTLIETFGAQIVTFVTDFIAAIAGVAIALALSAGLSFWFLRDGSKAWSLLTSRLAEWRRAELDGAGSRAVNVLGGYMVGTGVISAFGAVTQFAIMWILGIPLALPLAILSFFGGFIPYIGSFITTGIAFLVTVATGSFTDIVVMFVFTIVFNIVQGNVVAPLVYGRVASLHPAVVLLAIPAGADIAGIPGMFLVVPFLGVVAVTWRSVLRVFGEHHRDAPLDVAAPVPVLSDEVATPSTTAALPAPDPRPGDAPTG
jgi:predicted PurR-regulated permease PerM